MEYWKNYNLPDEEIKQKEDQMKKLNVKYSFNSKRVTFYLGSIFEKKTKHRELTEKELQKLCQTIQDRIIFKHIGTVMPQYFGFSYWSDF